VVANIKFRNCAEISQMARIDKTTNNFFSIGYLEHLINEEKFALLSLIQKFVVNIPQKIPTFFGSLPGTSVVI